MKLSTIMFLEYLSNIPPRIVSDPQEYKFDLEVPNYNEFEEGGEFKVVKGAVFTIYHKYSKEFYKWYKDVMFDIFNCTKKGVVCGECRVCNSKFLHDDDGGKFRIYFKITKVIKSKKED